LHDILDDKGQFKSVEALKTEFKIDVKVMEYNALKSNIPIQWRTAVKSMRIPSQAISKEEQPFFSCGKQLIALSILQNRDIYWELISKIATIPASALKWCTDYGIEAENWKDVYKAFVEIKETKLKAFQYKIIFFLIPCNLYLKRIGKSATDRCGKCNMLDDIKHYLAGCAETLRIWSQLSRWWSEMIGQEIQISEKDIILGLGLRENKLEKEYQLNMIILAVKWKIHATKQSGQSICFYQVLHAIRQMIDTLNFIASKNQKVAKHEALWGEILDFIT
jgi:hypothetical protein